MGGIDPEKPYRGTILEENSFQFKWKALPTIQAHGGTAMSTRTTVSFANMSSAYIETQTLLSKTVFKIQRKSYDIINVRTLFKQTENSRHPPSVKIKF